MRKYANEHGLQSVHLEIMTYLSICNKYSNTIQLISDYLGQTKGSISQSVTLLEKNEYLLKKSDSNDKRITHIQLTAKGKDIADSFNKNLQSNLQSDEKLPPQFEKILKSLQLNNNSREFGLCKNCSHNQTISKTKFRCGLTMEILSKDDIEKICAEYTN